jgi:hypothetical protein
VPTASIAPGTVAVVPAIIGAGSGGPLAAETPVYVLMAGAQATAGAADILVEFYCQKD